MKVIWQRKTRVFTVGVFDVFHVGHVNMLKTARSLGDYLIVAVQNNVLKYKPDLEIYYSLEERIQVVKSIRYVNQVIVYDDVDKIITDVNFDIFVKGPDQNHEGFQLACKYCEFNNKSIVELPRTEGVSSTIIRKIYG